MTILDAVVPVMCDGKDCRTEENIEPPYTYPDYSGNNGSYDTSDDTIEELMEQDEWVIVDGQHYCCQDCYDSQEE